MSGALAITGGHVLRPDGFHDEDVVVADGVIKSPGPAARTLDATRTLDAAGLLVLPGLVDLHGDAFERQLQPRPGVSFDAATALADTERQLLGNGITTAFHAITLSWEHGLRGVDAWTAWLDALDAHRDAPGCDMRAQLRWEAHNLDALDLALADIAAGRVGLLALNDHTPGIVRKLSDPVALSKFVARGPLSPEAFAALAVAAAARGAEVPRAVARLCAAAQRAGLPIASHDDDTVPTRDANRALGARICEFPVTEEVARAARAAGDWIIMGSPNVVRGGSHLGWASAAAMVEAGLCRALCSDYYYPAMLAAPFVLADRGVLDLAAAWRLVSTHPADAAGLADRGRITPGLRADLVLVNPTLRPQPVATIAAGQIAWLSPQGAARLT